ncbi:MAG: 6-phospho-3-hexuloisomerase [Planctomycetota bacterium]|jgi:6-phospho-3-hexuloisomerase
MTKWASKVGKQVEAVRSVLENVREDQTDRLLDLLLEAKKIFVVGRGRTGYIVGTFAMRLMHLGFDVHVVGDCTTPRINKRDLLVACSGSGRVRMVTQMAQIARRAKARITFVTYNPDVPKMDNGDHMVLIPAQVERDPVADRGSVLLPLGTLFEEALMLYMDLVTNRMMERMEITEAEMARRHTNLE